MLYLKDYNFGKPARLNLRINVKPSHHPGNKAHWGTLQSLTPEEALHAFLLAIARDIALPQPIEVLQGWRFHALSCVGTLVSLEPGQEFWDASQIRENIGAAYD